MNKFEEIRNKMGITMEKMTEVLNDGVNRSSICFWENNISLPGKVRLLKYKKIAEKLGIDFSMEEITTFYLRNRVSRKRNKKHFEVNLPNGEQKDSSAVA